MSILLCSLLLLISSQVGSAAVLSRTPPQQSKNLLSSRNCFFSPTQCFLPKVFDKYVPAQNTSSMLGKNSHRIRLHQKMLGYLKKHSQSNLYVQA